MDENACRGWSSGLSTTCWSRARMKSNSFIACMYSSWLWSRSHRAAPVNFCRSHQADIARYEYDALSSELICSLIASTTRMFMPAILPLGTAGAAYCAEPACEPCRRGAVAGIAELPSARAPGSPCGMPSRRTTRAVAMSQHQELVTSAVVVSTYGLRRNAPNRTMASHVIPGAEAVAADAAPGGLLPMQGFWRDVRFAARGVTKSPGFTT